MVDDHVAGGSTQPEATGLNASSGGSAGPASASSPSSSAGAPILDAIKPEMTAPQQRDAIVADQHNALITEFAGRDDAGAIIACNDVAAMTFARCRDSKGNVVGGIEALEGISLDDAFVIRTKSGACQLWVKPSESGYARIYDKFTAKYYGVAWSQVASSNDWNVDHLYPKGAGMVKSVKFVRVTAIDKTANQSAGRTIEKQMVKREREIVEAAAQSDGPKRAARPMFKAPMYAMGKLTGFHEAIKLPSEIGGFAGLSVTQRLVAHVMEKCRLVEPAVMTELNEMLTRRHITDIQTPLNQRMDKRQRFDQLHRKRFGGG